MTDKYDAFLDAPETGDKYDTFLNAPEEEWKGSTNAKPEASKRSATEEIARSLGLTARMGIQGVLAPFTAASDAAASLYNLGAGALGSTSRMPMPSAQQEKQLAALGIPAPENALERAVQAGGQAMVGQAGLTKAAQALGATASPLLVRPTQQVVAAGASGITAQPTAEYVQNVTGSPVASLVASLAVGSLAGKYAGKAADVAGGAKVKPVTIDDVKQQAQRSYTQMEQMDIKAKPASVMNMIDTTEGALSKANFNPQMDAHKPVAQLLEQFRTMTGTQRVPFSKLEQMRSAAVSMSRESSDAATRRLAGIVVSNIDDYMSRLNSKDLMPGTQRGEEAVKAVLDARNNWKLQARAQVIEDVLDTAALRAENPKASEADLIRQGLTNLAANKTKMRQFSDAEQAAIKEAVKSKSADFLLNLLGKFNPERGGLGAAILSGGIGGTAYTGSWVPSAGSAALTGSGFAADKLYGALKRRGAEKLASDILTGTAGQVKPDYRLPGLFGAANVKPEGQW